MAAGIPGLFGFFTGWVGGAVESDVPAHSVAMTLFGPAQTQTVLGPIRSLNIVSGARTHDSD